VFLGLAARKLGLGCVLAIAGFACARSPNVVSPVAVPSDGTTQVLLDTHLPDGFSITNVRAVMDGEPISTLASPGARTSLFHARILEGDHTLQLIVDVRVPCGLTSEPYEKLTARIVRSFEVGPAGGLVYIDTFAQSPWLHPAERVSLLVSLRGMGMKEGRWVYGRSNDAKQACGRLDPIQRSRCVVQRLVERSRTQKDVAALLCQKDKLEAIDDMIGALQKGNAKEDSLASSVPSISSSISPALAAPKATIATRINELEREAEYCVSEDLAMSRDQEVTSDRSACAAYDEPLSMSSSSSSSSSSAFDPLQNQKR
jgi:hypothetical protein